jgi:glycerol kinase
VLWLRDGLRVIESAPESEALARSVSGNDGVYFVPAFVGLGAPHWEPDARGTVVGLTRGSRREHLVRAALEAMAFGTCELLRAQEADSGVAARELRVDGGASTNDFLMEFQAGLLGIPVRRPALVETTALGAAGLAGLAGGVWRSAPDFLAASGEATVFPPSMDPAARDALMAGWARAVRAAKSWAEDAG